MQMDVHSQIARADAILLQQGLVLVDSNDCKVTCVYVNSDHADLRFLCAQANKVHADQTRCLCAAAEAARSRGRAAREKEAQSSGAAAGWDWHDYVDRILLRKSVRAKARAEQLYIFFWVNK